MANFYSSKPGGVFGKQTVRDWLNGKSFKEQYQFARKTYERIKQQYEKTGGKGEDWWR